MQRRLQLRHGAAALALATAALTTACLDAPSAPQGSPAGSAPALVADLAVTITAAPDTVAIATEAVRVTVQYSNGGDVSIPAGWEAAISSISVLGVTTVVKPITFDSALAPGDTITRIEVVSPFALVSGIGGLRIVVDVNNVIPEANTANNEHQVEIAYTFAGGYGQIWNVLSGAAADTLGLIRFESNPNDGILVTAIPDTVAGGSSAINPTLMLSSATNVDMGGDLDAVNVAAADTGERGIGTRSIAGGELIAIIGGSRVEKNQLRIGAASATPGRAQVIIQNCFRMDAAYGDILTDSLIESDCLLWPNPVSGVRTRAVLVSLSATSGDDLDLSLESSVLNTLLLVFGPDGSLLATDDDGGTGTNSALTLAAPATGNYMILISSLGLLAEGEWSLTISDPAGTAPRAAAHPPRSQNHGSGF